MVLKEQIDKLKKRRDFTTSNLASSSLMQNIHEIYLNMGHRKPILALYLICMKSCSNSLFRKEIAGLITAMYEVNHIPSNLKID